MPPLTQASLYASAGLRFSMKVAGIRSEAAVLIDGANFRHIHFPDVIKMALGIVPIGSRFSSREGLAIRIVFLHQKRHELS